MTKKRVVIADDHPLVHQAMGQCLKASGDFELVGSAMSGPQVGPLVARTSPDLVLLDLNMPIIDGLHCLALLREKHPRVKVVVFSGSDDSDAIEEALGSGAAAFVAKSIDPADLPSVLRQTFAGNVYHSSPCVNTSAVTERKRKSERDELRDRTGLTERELEVLGAVARGLSNRAAGKELFLSDQTVKFHLHNIYGKLGVANRTEGAAAANQLGLVAA